MPFARTPLVTLRQQIRADIAARLPGSDPFVRRSVLAALADVIAKAQNDQFGYLDWQARQAVPATAEGEYEDAWAALRGVARKGPLQATGTATIAGALPGTGIALGTQLTRSDGVLFAVSGGVPVVVGGDGTATLPLTAILAGLAGNTDAGTTLTFVTPPAGVPSGAAVVTMSGGADRETDDAERNRMLQAYANPPQGGDLQDYVTWALATPNLAVTRAWAAGYAIKGAGTVSVFFMCDDASHPNGLPNGTNGVATAETRDTAATGDQLLVAGYLYPKRPVTALVYAMAAVGDPLNLTLAEVPADATIRAGIATALNGFLLREASPGGATLADLTAGGTVLLSHLADAIAAVPGLDHFVLQSPAADIAAAPGHIAIPGTITYL